MVLKPKCIKENMKNKKIVEKIIKCINHEFGIDLLSNMKNRREEYVFGRALLYDICRKHLKMSLSDIGDIFKKNHATVIHSLKQLPYMMKYDSNLRDSYEKITRTWLLDSEELIPIPEEELKTRIKNLVNENKLLTLKVRQLEEKLLLYSKKYKKHLVLVSNIEHKVGEKQFPKFERKLNALLNGM